MLFNSIEFALFLPLVFLLYWFVFRNLKLQNLFVVLISYIFYGWWDWRFLLLIAFTSATTYTSGLLIKRYRARKRAIYWCSATNIILNLVILCTFKYFNFFGDNLYKLFEIFGLGLDWVTVDILLPVGISFYTFQALSYTIDVYKNKIEPTRNIISFFAYVSFFPQIIAGPIERATNLLPQFYKTRKFDYAQAVDGTRQILWGLFKKVVVADNCAMVANQAFENYTDASSSTLILGAIMFTFQIYGDFSGYSDIAIGTSRLFGFNLMQNFNYPYFARDIAEFWRRWHISLTTWFRDYVYIPLGGSRGNKWQAFRNTMIIFLLSGFWHGANWTFIVWGAFHAILFLPLILTGHNRRYTKGIVANNSKLPSIKELTQMLITFGLVVMGWIIFRAESIDAAFQYIGGIFDSSILSMPMVNNKAKSVIFAIFLLLIEWIGRRNKFALEIMPKSFALRLFIYWCLVISIIYLGGNQETFIYFQF